MTRLFCLAFLLLAAPLAANADLDAAIKDLRSELELCDKLLAEMEPKPAKGRNGMDELNAWFEAAHAIKEDHDAPWFVALTDPACEGSAPPSAETIRDALERTQDLPALAEKASGFDIFVREPKDVFEGVAVLPILSAFRYGVGRVALLQRTSRDDAARQELRVLAKLLGKQNAHGTLMMLVLYQTLREQIISKSLLLFLGDPKWDAAFAKDLLALMPEPSTRPKDLLLGELGHMAENVRKSYLNAGDVLEQLRKAEERRMKKVADPVAEAQKILCEVRLTLAAVRTLIEADRKEAIDTSTRAGAEKAAGFANDLGEGSHILTMPCFAALRRGVISAALKLKLLELEKGPLAKQKAQAEKVVAGHLALALRWVGETAIVALDEAHDLVKTHKLWASEIKLAPKRR